MKLTNTLTVLASIFACIAVTSSAHASPTQGTLLVSGMIGAGQSAELDVASCKSTASGQIAEFGCDNVVFAPKYSVDQPISLTPGNYRIEYSNTEMFVQIQANKTTQIALKQIAASSQANTVARVFVDWGDPSMQSRGLLEAFTNSDNQLVYEDSCIGADTSSPFYDASVCKALSAGTPQAYLNAIIRFNSDDSITLWNDDIKNTFTNVGRTYVADITDDFISVLPGVYGIELDSQNRTEKNFERQLY